MATCPKCRSRYDDDVKHCVRDGETLLPDEAFASADPDLEAGDEVGEYEIVEKIGAGGFGTVYRARQPLIGKEVAIKLLNREYSSNPQMVSRFIEEARAVNQIRHRNIIDIFSFGTHTDKRQYFVMEFLDGKPFDAYLSERKRLTPEEAIPILRQIAKALDAAHAAGIAHRDLKPENVFLSFDDDGQAFPKLLDFGIAKLLGGSRRSGHKTATGQPIGTPYYMSPEQCLGSGVDHRADIYSFGVMCHEVLAGKLPFYAEEMMNVLVMQMSKDAPSMSSMCPGLPPSMDGPVLHMLAKDPGNRPDSVQGGLEALAQAAKDAGFAVEPAPVRRGMSTPGRMASPVVTGGDKLTPTEQALMGAAATVADVSSQPRLASSATPSGAAVSAEVFEAMAPTQRAPGAGGKGKLIGVAIAGLVAAAAATVFFLRGPDESGASVGVTYTTQSAEPAAAEPPPTTTAVASASVAVEAGPPKVEIIVKSTPTEVMVAQGDVELGKSTDPIELDQADEPIELTFTAPGYLPKTRKVTPNIKQQLEVRLDPLPRRPVASPPETAKPPVGSGDVSFEE
jgi:serine/threonine-protein kinase